jgi:hypothetical protein
MKKCGRGAIYITDTSPVCATQEEGTEGGARQDVDLDVRLELERRGIASTAGETQW